MDNVLQRTRLHAYARAFKLVQLIKETRKDKCVAFWLHVLFIMLYMYNVVLTHKAVDKIPSATIQMKIAERYFPVH